MFRNYFLLTLRHLLRQPLYTFLNVFGLTLGLTASLFIVLYLYQELSYDGFHTKADRIYRVSSDIKEPDDAFRWTSTQMPLGATLKVEFAEVEEYVRFIPFGRVPFTYEDETYFEEKIFCVDSTVFDVFTFDLLKGDPTSALDAPNSIVLNASLAKTIFGKEDPIGKSLKVDDQYDMKVTGVYKDLPQHGHILPNALFSSNTVPRFRTSQSWGGFNIYTYVLLKEGIDANLVEQKLGTIIDKYVATIFDQFNIEIKYELWPIKDIHLYSDFEGEPEPTGDINYIYIFSIVGLFLIFIACINYMNMATARSFKRATEVGIRKVLGAKRGGLIWQFLSESLLLTSFSLVLSLVLLATTIPILNELLGLRLSISTLAEPLIIVAILGLLAITGILGGSYPAFFLSAFRPLFTLKGGHSGKSGNKQVRKGLVIAQFAISMFMFAGTGIIYQQMQYLRTKDLGFDKEQTIRLTINNREDMAKWPVLQEKLLTNPNIKSTSSSTSSPGSGFSKQLMSIEEENGGMVDKGIDNYRVDFDFFPNLGIEFVAGRNFSREFGTDSTLAVIINEAMVERMAWTEPIGKKVRFGTEDSLPLMRVIGVVKDFHQQSLYNPIEPLLFLPRFNNPVILVNIEGNIQETLDDMEKQWASVYPGVPFHFRFIDELFMEQYETDQLRGRLFLLFSLLTIFIACMGLLGLASYTSEQRSKEISIRKVLGANTETLVSLLIKDFVIIVAIAAIPAFGFSWYAMNEWLNSFQYHIHIGLWVFVFVLLVTALVTVLTTGVQAWYTANMNPVMNLKDE